MRKIPIMKATSSGKGSTSRSTARTATRTASRPAKSASRPPARKAERKTRSAVPLIAAVVAGGLLLIGGGVFLGATLLKGSQARQLDQSLERAEYYAGKGEYQEAMDILNRLNINDAKVRTEMDSVLNRKQAADQAAQAAAQQQAQQAAKLAAQQAADAVRKAQAELALAETKKADQKLEVRQPTPEEQASAQEKARQQKVADLMQKGAAAFNAGRYQEARQDFEQAAGLAPDNADALAYAGLSYLRASPNDSASVQKAVDLSKAAIDKNPSLALPHKTLAEIYENRKLNDDAMREYRAATQLDPKDSDSLYSLGKLQYRAGQFSDAAQSFAGCVALKPDFSSADFNLGMSLAKLGNSSKSLDAFRAAVAAKRDFAEAYYMIGSLLRDRGDLGGALDSFKQAVQYAPAECRVHAGTGLDDDGSGRFRGRRCHVHAGVGPGLGEPSFEREHGPGQDQAGKAGRRPLLCPEGGRKGSEVRSGQLHPWPCERAAGQRR